MAHPEAWPTEERVSTVDEIRISPAGDGFYAAASEATHTHVEQAERDCFFCLEGWVFLGSIDHDGWEVLRLSDVVGVAVRAGKKIDHTPAPERHCAPARAGLGAWLQPGEEHRRGWDRRASGSLQHA
jgi:hypothetical protein